MHLLSQVTDRKDSPGLCCPSLLDTLVSFTFLRADDSAIYSCIRRCKAVNEHFWHRWARSHKAVKCRDSAPSASPQHKAQATSCARS